MLKRFAAVALFLSLAVPATSFAIPTITASPTPVTEGTAGVAISLFFNVFVANDTSGANVFVDAPGTTTFVSVVGQSVGGAATSANIINPGPAGARAGFTLGPLLAGSELAPGNYQFATLTINAGNPLDNLVVGVGSTWLQAPFCTTPLPTVGDTLVSITPIPEPTAVLLIGGGLAGLAFLRRKVS